MEDLVEIFSLKSSIFAAQLVNLLVLILLFFLAARAIVRYGKGKEVPIWLVLSFFVPVVVPIIALLCFRSSRRKLS